MSLELLSVVEKKAARAEHLAFASGISLSHVKKVVAELLGLIGGSVIFDQYTKHDISHINRMLEICDWIAPPSSIERMTPAECLMVTLGVYFHDMGMLVTEDEFRGRQTTNFASFKDSVLFTGDNALDYRSKVDLLGPEAAERFYYQEFVRHNHATRVREWVAGQASPHLGDTQRTARELDRLLDCLSKQFRDDLGLVCASHHSDDLDDFTKYRLRKAYGPSDDEVVNLQYCAIILRTADLLHMTSDRTPSVTFRVTNPSDPVSQREWAKQMGVNKVCSKLGVDSDGNVSETAVRSAVEVHAYFDAAEPYFALTSFLNYVSNQLQQSWDWAKLAQQKGAKLEFPWRHVVTDEIQTKGFLSRSFSFELDQNRILKLLTGHTLYNDSGVVLRELVQNAVDAVRLRTYQENKQGVESAEGRIEIRWDTSKRVLSVTDNGTGMTQDVIERYFLTVGSSLYSDERFREQHPEFSSISRFGIGILASFMVADRVDVFTSHAGESDARHLSLRNLLGKYLISLVPKAQGIPGALGPTGTRIELILRPSARTMDVLALAQFWVLVPGMNVTVVVDGQEPVKVGAANARDALAAVLSRHSEATRTVQGKMEVRSASFGEVDVAFVVVWSKFFQEWQFATLKESRRDDEDEGSAKRLLRRELGVAVQGIRVSSGPFGFFEGETPLTLVNASGQQAPRTNVARSGLEESEDLERLYRSYYDVLVSHVVAEFHRIEAGTRSLTWAADEGRILIAPLYEGRPTRQEAFSEVADQTPLQLVEERAIRKCVTPASIRETERVWTVDCPFFDHAESLLRESSGDSSLAAVSQLLHSAAPPEELLLLGGAFPESLVLRGRAISHIRVWPEQRRVDFAWSLQTSAEWISLDAELSARLNRRFTYRVERQAADQIRVAIGGVTVETESKDLTGVRGRHGILLFPRTKAAETFAGVISRLNNGADEAEERALLQLLEMIPSARRYDFGGWSEGELGTAVMRQGGTWPAGLDRSRVLQALQSCASIYSPYAWERKKSEEL